MGKNKLLYPSLTLPLLLLLPTDASVSGKPQYMVLVPSLLHTETPEKGCLLLSHLNETVTVSASLESVCGGGDDGLRDPCSRHGPAGPEPRGPQTCHEHREVDLKAVELPGGLLLHPGHSGSSPRLVQIRSSHFHQR
uniref:Alpha-2-macroglobulin variant 7 n=1 Tax=Bos taurus TaxID=9913 RepID=K4JR76_BOVIN|nr:alpha-2-macroglobulin variant 7 [Bos taurus]